MTKEQWDKELTPKQRWDVLVAMRGPDCHNSDPVKWFTSSVIRDHMSKVIRVGGLVNTYHLDWILVPYGLGNKWAEKGDKIPRMMWWDHSHFFNHVTEAAQVLGLRVIYVPGEIWLEAITGSDSYNYPVKLIPQILLKLNKDNEYDSGDIEILKSYVGSTTGKAKVYGYGNG